MDDAHAAELRHRDGHVALGHRVHGGRDQRDIEADAAGEPGAGIGAGWQHLRIAGDEQARRRRRRPPRCEERAGRAGCRGEVRRVGLGCIECHGRGSLSATLAAPHRAAGVSLQARLCDAHGAWPCLAACGWIGHGAGQGYRLARQDCLGFVAFSAAEISAKTGLPAAGNVWTRPRLIPLEPTRGWKLPQPPVCAGARGSGGASTAAPSRVPWARPSAGQACVGRSGCRGHGWRPCLARDAPRLHAPQRGVGAARLTPYAGGLATELPSQAQPIVGMYIRGNMASSEVSFRGGGRDQRHNPREGGMLATCSDPGRVSLTGGGSVLRSVSTTRL